MHAALLLVLSTLRIINAHAGNQSTCRRIYLVATGARHKFLFEIYPLEMALAGQPVSCSIAQS
jgi:hypothetical protein